MASAPPCCSLCPSNSQSALSAQTLLIVCLQGHSATRLCWPRPPKPGRFYWVSHPPKISHLSLGDARLLLLLCGPCVSGRQTVPGSKLLHICLQAPGGNAHSSHNMCHRIGSEYFCPRSHRGPVTWSAIYSLLQPLYSITSKRNKQPHSIPSSEKLLRSFQGCLPLCKLQHPIQSVSEMCSEENQEVPWSLVFPPFILSHAPGDETNGGKKIPYIHMFYIYSPKVRLVSCSHCKVTSWSHCSAFQTPVYMHLCQSIPDCDFME